MPKNKKQYDDDDGRTIADMTDVSRPPLIIPSFNKSSEKEQEQNNETNIELTGSERRAFIGGALGAVLAIGSVFAIAGFLFILLLTKIL